MLNELSRQFDTLYSHTGRPSMAPEKLLRALLLQGLYTIRSERLRMEQLDDKLLLRWFVGRYMGDAVWDPTGFSKNRARLLAGEVAQACFDQVLAQARERELLSDDHCTGDGTLIEAWAMAEAIPGQQRVTLGADTNDATRDCVRERRERRVSPHVAQHTTGGASAMDGRTPRHPG